MLRRFLAVFAFCLAAHSAARAEEVIHRFESLVQVARDGTLTVTETIVVRAEGREIKRGIYRDFPLTFRDPAGNVRQVTFNLLGVTRDGRPEPHFTRRSNNGVRIYAGQEDVLLQRGDYSYTFRYQTSRQLRWFEKGPELYWNVTGNEWNFPIERASVRVVLEDGARPERWTAYSGRYGERGTDWRGEFVTDGSLRVETTRRLAPGEGLSIVAALPASAVNEPSDAQKLQWLLIDYRSWIVGGIGFALVLAYYAFAWNAVGRDPKRGTVIPMFYPPEGISPALANYVHTWGFGRNIWRAFTAAALSLAVRGSILFDDRSGELTLKSTGKPPPEGREKLPPGERAIYDWLLSEGGEAKIDRANGTAVAKIAGDFKERVEKENKDKFFRKNLGYFIAGLALTAAVVIGILMFGRMQEEDLFVLFFFGFISIWLGVFLVPLMTALFRGISSGKAFHTALIVIVFLVFVFTIGSQVIGAVSEVGREVLPLFVYAITEHPFPFVLIGSFAAINGMFLYLLRAPTDIGAGVMDKLEGLRLYLTVAEEARLNMNAPEITAERFEALLPYAVALDVEKPWSDAFAAALQRAHPSEPAPTYRPHWHSGSAWSGSNIGNAVASSVTAATGAFATAIPPSSSGSSGFSGGGGGGSGGGGGGGGGGGW